MLNKAMLDASVSGGCSQHDCGHKHEDTMFLHSRCHTGAPQFLWKKTDKYVAMCVIPTCNKAVFEAAPKELREELGFFDPIFRQECHPDSAVSLSYTKDSGIVQIRCYECELKVGEMVLE